MIRMHAKHIAIPALLIVVSLVTPSGCGEPDPAPNGEEYPVRSAKEEDELQTRCMNHLRQIGTLMIVDHVMSEEWPKGSGTEFILDLARRHPEVLEHSEVLVCPADSSIDVDSESRKAALAALARGEVAAAEGICSYAGRDMRDHPLDPDADEAQALACDAGPYHADGVCVLYENGTVVFYTWKKLGLDSRDDFRLGPDGPALLKGLCVTPGE